MANGKHTERVPVYFTQDEYMDMLRCAARFDKKPGEFIRFEIRKSMYGSLGMTNISSNGNRSAFEAQDSDDERDEPRG